MSASWADDLEEYDNGVGRDHPLQHVQQGQDEIQDDDKQKSRHGKYVEFGYPNENEKSPLDVFKSNNEQYPFSEGRHTYLSSDDYLRRIKHKKNQVLLLRDVKQWDETKRHIYFNSVLFKCQQYPELEQLLLSYSNFIIQEMSGHVFWGQSRNEAGKVLMEVILSLKKNKKIEAKNMKKMQKATSQNIFSILHCD